MTAWEETIQSALLGTERKPYALPEQDGELGRLLLKMPGTGEQLLLTCASLLAHHHRVGCFPVRFSGDMAPQCADEEKPVCSQESAGILLRILQRNMPYLLREWLVLANRAGRIARRDVLPTLLDATVADKTLRPLALPVLGKRGLWLAAQNKAWNTVGAEVLSEEDWETGTKTARVAWLKECRRTDPGKAREVFQACWKEENAVDRASFLEVFETGLCPDDEPFLESCLTDRRKEVRKAAALLLARLPSSRLARQVSERALSCVSVEKKLLGSRMALSLPQAFDSVMKESGMDEKPPKSQTELGPQAWWLLQTIALVPPSVWCNSCSLSPRDLLKLAKKTDFFIALFGGWTESACLHPDTDWAEALLEYQPDATHAATLELVRLLTPQRAETFIFAHATSGRGLERLQRVNAISLQCLERPWSLSNSRTALHIIFESLTKPAGTDASRASEILTAAQFMDTSLYAEAIQEQAGTRSVDSPLSTVITDFMDVLKLRHDMYKELVP